MFPCQPKVTASLTRGWSFGIKQEREDNEDNWIGTKVSLENTLGIGDTEDPRGPFHSVRALLP